MFSRTIALAIVVAALCLAGLAQEPREKRTADLRVRVVDTSEHALENEVMVTLETAGGAVITQSFTQGHSEVEFDQVAFGSYRLHVSGNGIQDTTSESFQIVPMETIHMETVQVKLQEPGVQAVQQPGGMVSAAEINVPGNAKKEFDKGNQALAADKADEARKHYLKAIEIYPRYPSAYNNLGVTWIKLGDVGQARAAFSKALEIDSSNAGAALNLGRLAYRDRNWADAERYLSRSSASSPQDPEPLAMLANVELTLKNYDAAIADARKVHQLPHEKFAVVHLIAARALELKGAPDEAVEEYKIFLNEAPNAPNAPKAREALERLQAGKR